MNITLQYFDCCPNWKVADRRIREVITTLSLNADYSHQLVNSPDEAEKYGFHGSPSILIDGIDPFATEVTKVGYACRIYMTDAGPAEAPTIEQLTAALGV